MGREIRRVPQNWDHPKNEYGNYKPMYDEHFDDAFNKWLEDFDRIRRGEFNQYEKDCYKNLADWLEDYKPPQREYYRPWKNIEATWYQLWETVSEGTPVSPPFETKEDFIKYLAENGDTWGESGWGREKAEKFVNGDGWAPSFVMCGNKLMSGTDFVTLTSEED